MKYELIKKDTSAERTVMQDIIEDDIVVGQEPTDEYEVTITLSIRPTDGIAPEFPHSDICGSQDICSSPQLFAACHVLLRRHVPRHSP